MESESAKREIVDLFFPDRSAQISWFPALYRLVELTALRPAAFPKHRAVVKFYALADQVRIVLEMSKLTHRPPALRVDFSSWGRLLFQAWLTHDVSFFEDLARVSRTLAGVHKADKMDNDALAQKVIWTAYQLAFQLKRDPTRAEVMTECEQSGIRPGNWRKMRVRCHLDFLAGAGRGRPKGKQAKAKKRTRSKK